MISPGRVVSPRPNCSLEGQVAGIADRIAVVSHDLEDGMRAGLIAESEMNRIEIFSRAEAEINARSIEDTSIRRTRTAKAIIDMLVSDCIETSRARLSDSDAQNAVGICAMEANLMVISAESETMLLGLEKFLLDNFYMHHSLLAIAEKVRPWLEHLFEELCRRRQLMPAWFQHLIVSEGLERTVCDYIAGMTDRFCLKMLERI